MAYDGVRLFVDRAAMFAPGLDLRPTSAVVDICRLLDGLPLALELAAAHTRLVPLEDMARRLDAHLRVLTRVMRHGPRQVAGGLGATGRSDAVRLLELIRDYGQTRLAAEGIAAGAKEAHLRWALGLARTAELELSGPLQDTWLATLDAEHDNLRAALQWTALQSDGGHERATELVELTLALSRFWEVRGYLTEGRSWLEAAAGASAAGPDVVARCLNASGVLAHHQCDYPAARRLHEGSAAAFEQLGNRRGVAAALNGLAIVASSTEICLRPANYTPRSSASAEPSPTSGSSPPA